MEIPTKGDPVHHRRLFTSGVESRILKIKVSSSQSFKKWSLENLRIFTSKCPINYPNSSFTSYKMHFWFRPWIPPSDSMHLIKIQTGNWYMEPWMTQSTWLLCCWNIINSNCRWTLLTLMTNHINHNKVTVDQKRGHIYHREAMRCVWSKIKQFSLQRTLK